jgi:hypothetical protein
MSIRACHGMILIPPRGFLQNLRICSLLALGDLIGHVTGSFNILLFANNILVGLRRYDSNDWYDHIDLAF